MTSTTTKLAAWLFAIGVVLAADGIFNTHLIALAAAIALIWTASGMYVNEVWE